MTLESQMIIIFGGTGDLTRRKLIPALYHLQSRGNLTDCTPVVCVGRKELSREQLHAHLAVEKYMEKSVPAERDRLLARVEYLRHDLDHDSAEKFIEKIDHIARRYACTANKLIYLALPTTVFGKTAELIGRLDYAGGWRRVVFEKPFGRDLDSARQLNNNIKTVLEEEEIYRVDHYLGKELVQNILTLRFANQLFAGSWHGDSIDHVQITVAESLGVEKRAGYYDKSGAVRDMVQNHLLQLLCFVTMEPPAGELAEDGLRDAAVAILDQLIPLGKEDIVLGQYAAGEIDSVSVPGYRDEEGVADTSSTETYCALRVQVDTRRWRGVPIYLRTGKRMADRYAEVRVVFKKSKGQIFGSDGKQNEIIIRIQPDEGIAIAFNVQKPGEEDHTTSVLMDFCHHCHFGPNTPEAYESILRHVMAGDHSLFPRWDWIEASWRYIDRLLAESEPPFGYQAGSNGPDEAEQLLQRKGHSWSTEKQQHRGIIYPQSQPG